MPADDRKALGARAEELAGRFLEERGHQIVERNWRCRFGEVDLVTRDGDTLVFVEVRARRGKRFGSPEESLGARKRKRLETLASVYVQKRAWTGAWRIDAVTLMLVQGSEPEIQHYPSAFGP
jgi:putative endonuclease